MSGWQVDGLVVCACMPQGEITVRVLEPELTKSFLWLASFTEADIVADEQLQL